MVDPKASVHVSGPSNPGSLSGENGYERGEEEKGVFLKGLNRACVVCRIRIICCSRVDPIRGFYAPVCHALHVLKELARAGCCSGPLAGDCRSHMGEKTLYAQQAIFQPG